MPFQAPSTEDSDNNQKCQQEFLKNGISSFVLAKLLPGPAKFRATIPDQGSLSLAEDIFGTRRLFLISQRVRDLL